MGERCKHLNFNAGLKYHRADHKEKTIQNFRFFSKKIEHVNKCIFEINLNI